MSGAWLQIRRGSGAWLRVPITGSWGGGGLTMEARMPEPLPAMGGSARVDLGDSSGDGDAVAPPSVSSRMMRTLPALCGSNM